MCMNQLPNVVGSLLLENIDFFFLARSRRPESLSPFQELELMISFFNNNELTEDMKISLSERLGVTQAQVVHFFQTKSK